MTQATPSKIKALRGRHGAADALACEPDTGEVKNLQPTTWLDRYAMRVWEFTAPVLHRSGMLSQVDLAVLTQYCATYGLWLRAYEKWINAGSPLMWKGGNGQVYGHPLVKEWREAQRDALSIGAQLGLSPSARAKLGLAVAEQMKAMKKYGGVAGKDKQAESIEDKFFGG